MILFLAIVAGIWGLGRYMRQPASARWLMICLVYLAVLAIQIVFPEGAALRRIFGGGVGEWLAIGLLGALIWIYAIGLGRLRRRVRPENRARPAPEPSSATTERYARHILLREIGGPGQKRLREAKVLVIGAGGLGSPVLQYLAAAGVGTIGVIDEDVVEVTNLQRQVIHTDGRIGMPKVFSAQAAIAEQNPLVTVRPYHRRMTEEMAEALFEDYDLVIDGTDDVDTKYLANRASRASGTPLIVGALSQWEGQVSVFDPAGDGPCYACVFPNKTRPGLALSCAEGGVLGPLPGVVGSVMAVEAVKHLTGAGQTLVGYLMIYDALHGENRTIKVARRPDCPVCGG